MRVSTTYTLNSPCGDYTLIVISLLSPKRQGSTTLVFRARSRYFGWGAVIRKLHLSCSAFALQELTRWLLSLKESYPVRICLLIGTGYGSFEVFDRNLPP